MLKQRLMNALLLPTAFGAGIAIFTIGAPHFGRLALPADRFHDWLGQLT
jgi:hypothetical protein